MMKIKISHLVKTTAIITGLGFFFLAESADAQIRYSRSSNVPDFQFSVFKTPDTLPSDVEKGEFIGAIQEISYFDDCTRPGSLQPTTTSGFLCSPAVLAELGLDLDGDGSNDGVFFRIDNLQANLRASLQGDVVQYTFEVVSPFNVDGRTYLPNNFYQFAVNVGNFGLDPTRAVNDLEYIIDNDVLAVFNPSSEEFSVKRQDGRTISLEAPKTRVRCEIIRDDMLLEIVPCATTVPEPNSLAGLLVLADVPVLAFLSRFLKTKSNQK